MNSFEKLKIISTSFAAIFIPIIIAILGNLYSQAIKENETRLRLVELSIEILNEKQGIENAGLKKWAIDIINKYSEVPLSDVVKTALISDKIQFPESKNTNRSAAANLSSSNEKNYIIDELLKKNILPLLCEAYNILKNSAPSTNASQQACLKFQDVIKKLPTTVFSEKDKILIKQAAEDYKNSNFEYAGAVYKVLFNEYYIYCGN
jgi:hypothetical protein